MGKKVILNKFLLEQLDIIRKEGEKLIMASRADGTLAGREVWVYLHTSLAYLCLTVGN